MVDFALVVAIALGKGQLTADHLILGPRVADDIDALNIDARAVDDVQRNRDGFMDRVGDDLRINGREGIAEIERALVERVHAFLQRVAIEPVAGCERDEAAQLRILERADAGNDFDAADPVARPLRQVEGQVEGFAVRAQLRIGADDVEIGIALVQVEFVQKVFVVFDAIRIIFVGTGEEAEPGGLAR